MSSTSNCSPDKSNEHVVSRNILSEFSDGVFVSGLPWQVPGLSQKIGINSLTSKVLCRRHNEALSPLDEIAGDFFRKLRSVIETAAKFSMLRFPSYYFASGDGLEKWAVKLCMGSYFSTWAKGDDGKMFDTHTLDTRLAVNVLTGAILPKPFGLFVSYAQDEPLRQGIGIAPLSDEKSKRMNGLRISFHGVLFDFILDTTGGNPLFYEELYLYRPNLIDVVGKRRTGRLVLGWPGASLEGKQVEIRIGNSRELLHKR